MSQLSPSQYERIGSPARYGQSDGLYRDKTNGRLVLAYGGVTYAVISADGITADLEVSSEARGDLLRRGASAWERVSAKTAGQILLGNGTDVISSALSGDIGSISAAGSVQMADNVIRHATFALTKANIIGVAAGDLGHASGFPLVTAVGTHNVIEFISAILFYDYAGQGYANGGNISVGHSAAGSTVSGVVSAANSLGAAADKALILLSSVPTNNLLVENAGLSLYTSGGFTDAGASAGVLRGVVNYRVHATGL